MARRRTDLLPVCSEIVQTASLVEKLSARLLMHGAKCIHVGCCSSLFRLIANKMQSQDLLRDVATLLTGAERYLSESLHNENLSSRAKEQRDEILQSIHQIQNRYPFEFLQRGNEGTSISLGNEGLDESHNKSCGQSLTSDDVSLTSDNQDEAAITFMITVQY
ncbi:src kinase-associated phosphoprotein 1 [Bombina bombina]|uniref:src kinase-associated phosphoprotein 1 n=1 Tax=Bombina bombina TaxID=8345 RepID=UPI00235AFEBA|nr:src kinase-associated phosphoprotein 1 [Bombina bombina]